MSRDYFEDLPPELITQLSPLLSPGPLSALIFTCRRLHEILQPELEAALTPELGPKLLGPPHLINPNHGYGYYSKTPLHVAVESKRMDIAALLLEVGADTSAAWEQEELQPLHLVAFNKDLEMMKLLLQHGAPINTRFGTDGCSESAFHYASSLGNLEMVRLLLDHGADLESRGHFGTALGFAVHRRNQDMVAFLLENGANAEVTAPLFVLLVGGPPKPHKANLLYIAMGLRHPPDQYSQKRRRREGSELPKWIGLPLSESKKKLMAILLAYGASKDATMHTIVQHLTALAQAAQYTEDEYLAVVAGMLNEAENAIPSVSTKQ